MKSSITVGALCSLLIIFSSIGVQIFNAFSIYMINISYVFLIPLIIILHYKFMGIGRLNGPNVNGLILLLYQTYNIIRRWHLQISIHGIFSDME